MKKNLGTFFGLSHLGVGAALLALCAFTTVARADLINTLTASTTTQVSGTPFAQVFTMVGSDGNISSLILELSSVVGGTANVDLYDVSAGAPGSLLQILGSVTAAAVGDNQQITINPLNSYTLIQNTQYAIVLQNPTSGSIAWDDVAGTASGGAAPALGGEYYYNGSAWNTWNAGRSFQLDLQTTPVPEVPMTGMVMGFGALAIAIGRNLRRKLYPTA